MKTCDIHTCGGPRSYRVGKLEKAIMVCHRCMDELINRFGWKLLGGVLAKTPPTG